MDLRLHAAAILAALALAPSTVATAQTGANEAACQNLAVKANLVLGEETTISGRIVDNKGVPLRHMTIELRWLVSSTRESPRQSVQTDGNGNFHFEHAEPGPYRLLASPNRTYAQPAFLNCESKHCKLQIELEPSPTDAADRECPIR